VIDLPDLHEIADEGDLEDFIGEKVSARVELRGADFEVDKERPVLVIPQPDVEDAILERIILRKDQACLAQSAACSAERHEHDKTMGDYDVPATFTGTLRQDDKGGFYLSDAKLADDLDFQPAMRCQISAYYLECATDTPDGKLRTNWEIWGIEKSTGREVFVSLLSDTKDDPVRNAIDALPDGSPMHFSITGAAVIDRKGRIALTARETELGADFLRADAKPAEAPIQSFEIHRSDFGRHASVFTAKETPTASGATMTKVQDMYRTYVAVGDELGAKLKTILVTGPAATTTKTAPEDLVARISGRAREVKDGDGFRQVILVTAVEDRTRDRNRASANAPSR